ncbi:MAG: DUF2203 domain-containing protein [Phycisphaerae bacterium]|jgi:hypothetical protein|nr:DUF2203 domain-containing protein [Phycisphaerae bacterium]
MNTYNTVGLSDESSQMINIRYFTVEEANRSLVLVVRIVKDVLSLYCRAKIIEERNSILDKATERKERLALKRQYEGVLQELKVYTQELNSIGCQLRDWQSGTVEWPAMYGGREIYLCWRMGDAKVEYWHEAYEHFAARRRIGEDFDF